MHQSTPCLTLVDTFATRGNAHTGTIRLSAMLFVTVLTAAAAQFSVPVPFSVVPFTLQPMVVLLGGLVLGPRLALASQVLYLLAGVAGLPVFAASATLPPSALRLMGPTGGYLLSYPIAAWLVGSLAVRGFDRRYVTSVLAMGAGLLVIYTCGVAWLGIVAPSVAPGLQPALIAGVYPFLVADALKLVAGAGIVPGLWRLFGDSH